MFFCTSYQFLGVFFCQYLHISGCVLLYLLILSISGCYLVITILLYCKPSSKGPSDNSHIFGFFISASHDRFEAFLSGRQTEDLREE